MTLASAGRRVPNHWVTVVNGTVGSCAWDVMASSYLRKSPAGILIFFNSLTEVAAAGSSQMRSVPESSRDLKYQKGKNSKELPASWAFLSKSLTVSLPPIQRARLERALSSSRVDARYQWKTTRDLST